MTAGNVELLVQQQRDKKETRLISCFESLTSPCTRSLPAAKCMQAGRVCRSRVPASLQSTSHANSLCQVSNMRLSALAQASRFHVQA